MRIKFYIKLLLRKVFPYFMFWIIQSYKMPCPPKVKRRAIYSHSIKGGDWIETGTYLGETTKFLANRKNKVISIEPQLNLFEFNQMRFRKNKNVTIIHGTSQEKLSAAIEMLSGDINFFLDGHFSGGLTFDSGRAPIMEELEIIINSINPKQKIKVFIDDFRLFQQGNQGDELYPDRNVVISWLSNRGFYWNIDHDILQIWNFQ